MVSLHLLFAIAAVARVALARTAPPAPPDLDELPSSSQRQSHHVSIEPRGETSRVKVEPITPESWTHLDQDPPLCHQGWTLHGRFCYTPEAKDYHPQAWFDMCMVWARLTAGQPPQWYFMNRKGRCPDDTVCREAVDRTYGRIACLPEESEESPSSSSSLPAAKRQRTKEEKGKEVVVDLHRAPYTWPHPHPMPDFNAEIRIHVTDREWVSTMELPIDAIFKPEDLDAGPSSRSPPSHGPIHYTADIPVPQNIDLASLSAYLEPVHAHAAAAEPFIYPDNQLMDGTTFNDIHVSLTQGHDVGAYGQNPLVHGHEQPLDTFDYNPFRYDYDFTAGGHYDSFDLTHDPTASSSHPSRIHEQQEQDQQDSEWTRYYGQTPLPLCATPSSQRSSLTAVCEPAVAAPVTTDSIIHTRFEVDPMQDYLLKFYLFDMQYFDSSMHMPPGQP